MVRHRVIEALLLAGIVAATISILIFIRLDQIVHGDLYSYGLQFNYGWAGQYWIYSRLVTDCLAITIVVTGISAVLLMLNQLPGRIEYVEKVCIVLLLAATIATGLSALFFTKLDYVVHNELYQYGLDFSYEWVERYWMYARSMLSLLGFAGASSAVSIVLILTSKPAHGIRPVLSGKGLLRKFNLANSVTGILFSSGVLMIAFSIGASSSVLALLGLGLVFWGAVLFYIRPEKYVKETLFQKTTVQLFADLGHVIEGLGYRGTAVFLPPTLNDIESCKVYVRPKGSTELPPPEERVSGENASFSRILATKGMLFTPTGIGLARLIEEKIGENLERGGLEHLRRRLPKVLVGDLEIAQDVKIETRNPRFCIKLKGSIYGNVCKEIRKSSKFCTSVGCPLCSAIACLLAKSTGRPVMIEKDQAEEDGQIIDIEYRLL